MKQNFSGLLYFKPVGDSMQISVTCFEFLASYHLKIQENKNDLIFKIPLMNFIHTESLEMIISFMTQIFVH